MDGRLAEPFAFAGPVAGEHFAGRGAEAARLSESMRRGVSTILIAKDILVIEGGRPVIAGPILELWFRRRVPRR